MLSCNCIFILFLSMWDIKYDLSGGNVQKKDTVVSNYSKIDEMKLKEVTIHFRDRL